MHFLGDKISKHWWKYEDFRKSSYTCVYIFSYTCASNKNININETFSLPTQSMTLIMLQASQYLQIIQMPQYSSKEIIIPSIHDHWPRLLDTNFSCTLDGYEDLVDFNSLKISGLITNWREVIRLFNFCKMLLSDTCMKISP